jgi:hypothetical protein
VSFYDLSELLQSTPFPRQRPLYGSNRPFYGASDIKLGESRPPRAAALEGFSWRYAHLKRPPAFALKSERQLTITFFTDQS